MDRRGRYYAELERDEWTLVDVVRAYHERDHVYWVPPIEDRPPLEKGAFVKLLFRWADPPESGPSGERMWVSVEFAEGPDVHGHLNNDPTVPNPPLRCGEPVWFRQEHILDIIPAGADEALSKQFKTVYCDCHLSSEPCFVCEHLVSGVGCGFNSGDSDTLRPDAWCDECDKLVAGLDGREAAESEPKISMTCGGCYDSMRERNTQRRNV